MATKTYDVTFETMHRCPIEILQALDRVDGTIYHFFSDFLQMHHFTVVSEAEATHALFERLVSGDV